MKFTFSFFCQNNEKLLEFYTSLFGWDERSSDRSPIYRSLEGPNVILGFHAYDAYTLLSLESYTPQADEKAVSCYPTFYFDTHDDVNRLALRCSELGGTYIKEPFVTYYSQWQSVVSDPEGNIFRLASMDLPEGVTAPTL